MKQRRICLLNTVMSFGGVQKAVMQLARGLADKGHHVLVVTMYDRADTVDAFEREFNLPIIDLAMNPPVSRLVKGAAMIRGVARLLAILREQRVDVIQSFTHYSNIVGPVLGWFMRVPVRVTSQRVPLDDRSPLLRCADRQISRLGLAHRMVAVSESMRRYCIDREGLLPERVITIANGLDLDRWAQLEGSDVARRKTRERLGYGSDEVVIATTARLTSQKGHHFLLNAISRILPTHPAVRFLWIGDGALRDDLERRIRELGLEDHVQMLGTRRDIQDLLEASDLFVLPSLWEGMPNAVLEAMAARLAVVATAVDGTPELVVPGITGWLVPPRDSDALVLAMEQALTDYERRARMGQAGRQRVEELFTLERYVGAFETLYETILSDAPPSFKAHGERPH